MKLSAPVVTAIDVGTTKVCTIVGTGSSSARFQILAQSTVPSKGLRKGNVVDVEAVKKAVRASLDEVEATLGHKIESAHVGVTGAHVKFENRRDEVRVSSDRGVVTAEDLARMPANMSTSVADPERKVLHAIAMEYSVDKSRGIRNPVGMHADQMEVNTHLVTGASPYIDRLVRAVEDAGIGVDGLVLEPIASGQAVLAHEEREQGVMVVDIGGGTTDVVGFRNGRVFYSGVIPVGGYQFTNDMAFMFDTTYEVAEEAKLQYASVDTAQLRNDEEVRLRVNGSGELKIAKREICQLVRERAQELIKLMNIKLKESGMGVPSNLRLVLTGGASTLPGFEAMVRRSLTKHVRTGAPSVSASVPEELQDPAHATAVGILMWAMGHQPDSARNGTTNNGTVVDSGGTSFVAGIVGRFKRWISIAPFMPKKGRI